MDNINNNNLIKEEKLCNKCKIIKPFDCFQKQKATKDGYRNYCKTCMKIYNEKRYNNMDEEEKEENYQKILKWRAGHKEKISKYDKKYRDKKD